MKNRRKRRTARVQYFSDDHMPGFMKYIGSHITVTCIQIHRMIRFIQIIDRRGDSRNGACGSCGGNSAGSSCGGSGASRLLTHRLLATGGFRHLAAADLFLHCFGTALRTGQTFMQLPGFRFRTLAIQQRGGEVWEILAGVRAEFARFGEAIDRARRQLSAAAASIEETGRRSRALGRKLDAVERLNADESEEENVSDSEG